MSRRSAGGNQPAFSFTVLTRDTAGPAAQIRARTPVVLPKDAHAAWLYRELTDAAVAVEFAREQALTEFVHHPVDLRLDNARNENTENFSGSPQIRHGNAPVVLGYGRPGEVARAVDIVNDVKVARTVTDVIGK